MNNHFLGFASGLRESMWEDDLWRKGRGNLPLWRDQEAVAALFKDDPWEDWVAEAPRHSRDVPPGPHRRRPPSSKAARFKARPSHLAASMVPRVQFILRRLYPDQRKGEIYDRALLVVEHLWSGLVTADELFTYRNRSEKNPRRLDVHPT